MYGKDLLSYIYKIVHNDYWYDLDCGLAMLQEKGKLGVLCLNDLSEIYFKAD